ncbi:MAG: hypothetical protein Q8O67_08385 [Deltaproteobacteria bacterium]|nr:hypothetical protein [Deltaproteobacteria bacterium]
MVPVVLLLLAAQAPPEPPAATTTEVDPWVVCFVRAVDDTRTGLGPKIEELLKTALLSNSNVTVAPTSELIEAAGRAKLPRRKWLEPGVLAPVADELDVDFLLSAVVKAETRYAFKVTLTAVDRSATTTAAVSEVQIAVAPGKGRGGASFSSAEAQELVEKLIAALPPPATLTVPIDPNAPPPTDGPPGDAFATDWSDPADSTASVDALLNTLAPTFGGRLGVDSFMHPSDLYAPRDEAKIDGRQQVDLGIRASVGGNKAAGHLALLVRRDFADLTRARIEAEEAYADVDLWGLKLRAGRAYVAWGTTDLFSPTEVLAHFDYRDFLDIEKFPTWHLKASYSVEPFTFEAYLLPVPELNVLPPVERITADGDVVGRNRWVKGRFEGFTASVVPVNVTLVDKGAPGPSLNNLQPAARVRFSGFGLDASVGGGWLFDRFPTLRAPEVKDLEQPLPQQTVDVVVETEVLRRLALTTDLEWTLGSVRFSGEGVVFLTEDAFSQKKDDDVEDPFATVVFGVDTETPRFFDDHTVRFFVDATGTFTLTGEPLPQDPIGRLRYPLPIALLGRVEYLVGEAFKAELTIVDNFAQIDLGGDLGEELQDHDLLLQPAVQFVFFDVVTTRLEAAWLYGDIAGTFGQFQENSRVGGSVGVTF